MKVGPFDIALRHDPLPAPQARSVLSPVLDGRGSWWPIVRESFPGAWQQDIEVRAGDALAYFAVYACTTLIAADVAKCRLRLVERTNPNADVWTETESPAYSPVLRRPNHYQNRVKFMEQWLVSKLTSGNTYVLKERDNGGVVRALYILDPWRVRPMVAPNGDIYYSLASDNLTGLTGIPQNGLLVPASEIIHDIQCALYHPLVGVSPIYACGVAAMQGLHIQVQSNKFFSNGSKPGGILTAPGPIAQETADRLKAYWDTNFAGDSVGKVAVLGDGLKFEAMAVTAHDAQLIEQLRFTAETVCSCYHVLPYMIGLGQPPPYANVEPLLMAYYAQALQVQFNSIELALDEGLGLDTPVGEERRVLGTEFDIDDLLWMDTATRIKAATDSVKGVLSVNEARRKYLGTGPTPGGDAVYMQQQNYSIQALAKRDAGPDPFATTPPPAPAAPAPQPPAALPPAPAAKGLDVDWAAVLDLAVRDVEAVA